MNIYCDRAWLKWIQYTLDLAFFHVYSIMLYFHPWLGGRPAQTLGCRDQGKNNQSHLCPLVIFHFTIWIAAWTRMFHSSMMRVCFTWSFPFYLHRQSWILCNQLVFPRSLLVLLMKQYQTTPPTVVPSVTFAAWKHHNAHHASSGFQSFDLPAMALVEKPLRFDLWVYPIQM